MAAHGAYRLLLDHYYSTEKPLPADPVALFLVCSAIEKSEQALVLQVANEFFPVGPDGLRHNERADREVARAQKRIASAIANGQKGGRKSSKEPSPEEPKANPAGTPPGNPMGFAQEPTGNPAGHIGEAFHHAPQAIPKTPTDALAGNGLPAPIALPGNLTAETWANWRSHLANLRKPLTPQAERLQLVRLAGHADPEAVVLCAIENGHRVLQPVGGWPEGKGQSIHERRAATAAAMYAHRSESNEEPTDITAESTRVA